MPGHYRERPSRRMPTNDPACADLVQDNGHGGLAPSYRYQVTCPNDQNLIYVQGRAVPEAPPPMPPLAEREGIPDLGKCVRCNLQLEGSGVKPTDVIMDAGMNYNGVRPDSKPGLANGCGFQPECSYAKDVVLRVDRADGFVARNFLTKSSTRARHLHRGGRRLPAREDEDVLVGRVRQPDLHLRPRPVQELRRFRRR